MYKLSRNCLHNLFVQNVLVGWVFFWVGLPFVKSSPHASPNTTTHLHPPPPTTATRPPPPPATPPPSTTHQCHHHIVHAATSNHIYGHTQHKHLRKAKSTQGGSFRPDVPADIRPQPSVRPSNPKKKPSILARTCRADIHQKTSV